MTLYHAYAYVNAADTCRDPDDIHIVAEFGYTDNLSKLKEKLGRYVKDMFLDKKRAKTRIDGYDGVSEMTIADNRSYGVCIVVKPVNKME